MVVEFFLNPNGVASKAVPGAPQPRWGWKGLDGRTQGSSCLATLGFITESRWDSAEALSNLAAN
jgi:hypothetical protein